MPTVCIDCRYVGPRPSGISEMVRELAGRAPALAPELDFLFLTHPRAPLPGIDPQNVERLALRNAANGPVSMWALPLTVDLSRIDLFHAPANILPAGLTMRSVTTIHDLMWLDRPDLCLKGPLGRLERAFYAHGIQRALRHSDSIATVSEATRRAVLARTPDAGPRTSVTLSGVSPEFRRVRGDRAALAEIGLDPARKFVLTVGQNAPYKNHAGAVRSFALAFAERDCIDLVLVQRRDRSNEDLRRLIAQEGLGGRVHLTGPVRRDQLVLLYSEASVLLHPSLCEGFGNPLAEAMACGCPVVTGNLSAMPEVTAGSALLADPQDPVELAACLRRVLDEPGLVDVLRARGLARAEELDWQAFAKANVAIYRKLLSAS